MGIRTHGLVRSAPGSPFLLGCGTHDHTLGASHESSVAPHRSGDWKQISGGQEAALPWRTVRADPVLPFPASRAPSMACSSCPNRKASRAAPWAVSCTPVTCCGSLSPVALCDDTGPDLCSSKPFIYSLAREQGRGAVIGAARRGARASGTRKEPGARSRVVKLGSHGGRGGAGGHGSRSACTITRCQSCVLRRPGADTLSPAELCPRLLC